MKVVGLTESHTQFHVTMIPRQALHVMGMLIDDKDDDPNPELPVLG